MAQPPLPPESYPKEWWNRSIPLAFTGRRIRHAPVGLEGPAFAAAQALKATVELRDQQAATAEYGAPNKTGYGRQVAATISVAVVERRNPELFPAIQKPRYFPGYNDLGGFKNINERYQHEGGNVILTAVSSVQPHRNEEFRLRYAELLARSGKEMFQFRPGEIHAQFHGDEFALFLIGDTLEEQWRRVDQLKDLVFEVVVDAIEEERLSGRDLFKINAQNEQIRRHNSTPGVEPTPEVTARTRAAEIFSVDVGLAELDISPLVDRPPFIAADEPAVVATADSPPAPTEEAPTLAGLLENALLEADGQQGTEKLVRKLARADRAHYNSPADTRLVMKRDAYRWKVGEALFEEMPPWVRRTFRGAGVMRDSGAPPPRHLIWDIAEAASLRKRLGILSHDHFMREEEVGAVVGQALQAVTTEGRQTERLQNLMDLYIAITDIDYVNDPKCATRTTSHLPGVDPRSLGPAEPPTRPSDAELDYFTDERVAMVRT
jgi:GGDEF domain-containing protein